MYPIPNVSTALLLSGGSQFASFVFLRTFVNSSSLIGSSSRSSRSHRCYASAPGVFVADERKRERAPSAGTTCGRRRRGVRSAGRCRRETLLEHPVERGDGALAAVVRYDDRAVGAELLRRGFVLLCGQTNHERRPDRRLEPGDSARHSVERREGAVSSGRDAGSRSRPSSTRWAC